MKRYQKLRTSEGHKFLVRMTDEEISARRAYNTALVVLPLITSMVMFLLWVKLG